MASFFLGGLDMSINKLAMDFIKQLNDQTSTMIKKVIFVVDGVDLDSVDSLVDFANNIKDRYEINIHRGINCGEYVVKVDGVIRCRLKYELYDQSNSGIDSNDVIFKIYEPIYYWED